MYTINGTISVVKLLREEHIMCGSMNPTTGKIKTELDEDTKKWAVYHDSLNYHSRWI
jgi:hypothetical protein